MKEDYLWDKTGVDPEIERLENALAVFRCQETEPPALPAANIVSIVKNSPRKQFSFSFGFAFAVVVVFAVVLGVWFRFSINNSVSKNDFEAAAPKQIETERRDEAKIHKDNDFRSEVVVTTRQPAPRNAAFLKPHPRINQRQNTTATLDNKNKVVTLTSEEKYAYGQLLLALSITSSKLKLVHDTINRLEEGTSVINKNNR